MQRSPGCERQPAVYSLIHADMHPGNVLVDGDRLTIIDFDDAAWGWHAYDIAVALVLSPARPRSGGVRARLRRRLPVGAADLRTRTLTLLPMFRLVRGLAQIGWFHQRPELNRAARFEETKAVVLEQCLSIGREI